MKFNSIKLKVILILSAFLIAIGSWFFVDFQKEVNPGSGELSLSKLWASNVDPSVISMLEESAGLSAHFTWTNVDPAYQASRFSDLSVVTDSYVLGSCPNQSGVSPHMCFIDTAGNAIVYMPTTLGVSASDITNIINTASYLMSSNFRSPTFFNWQIPTAQNILYLSDGSYNQSYFCVSPSTDEMALRIPGDKEVLSALLGVAIVNPGGNVNCNDSSDVTLSITSVDPISIPKDHPTNTWVSNQFISPAVFNSNELINFDLTSTRRAYYKLVIYYKDK